MRWTDHSGRPRDGKETLSPFQPQARQAASRAQDTLVAIRSASALGRKYVELSRALEQGLRRGTPFRCANARLTAARARTSRDSTNDPGGRSGGARGLRSALAGRAPRSPGIEAGNPLLRNLLPVCATLQSATELDGFLRGSGVPERAAPGPASRLTSSPTSATFAATAQSEARAADRRGSGDAGHSIDAASANPVPARFADLSRRLGPAARQLRISLPPINEALRVGTPVLLRVPALSEDLEQLSGALEDLGENPSTLLALKDLRKALRVTRPLIQFAAPYQTVCNYFVYFWVPTGAHLSQVVRGPDGTALGTVQRILSLPPSAQDNSLTTSARRGRSTWPLSRTRMRPTRARRCIHSRAAGRDAGPRGCQPPDGLLDRLATDDRWGPNRLGGAHIVVDPNTPGNAGGTWVARKLGITSLKDLD